MDRPCKAIELANGAIGGCEKRDAVYMSVYVMRDLLAWITELESLDGMWCPGVKPESEAGGE